MKHLLPLLALGLLSSSTPQPQPSTVTFRAEWLDSDSLLISLEAENCAIWYAETALNYDPNDGALAGWRLYADPLGFWLRTLSTHDERGTIDLHVGTDWDTQEPAEGYVELAVVHLHWFNQAGEVNWDELLSKVYIVGGEPDNVIFIDPACFEEETQ